MKRPEPADFICGPAPKSDSRYLLLNSCDCSQSVSHLSLTCFLFLSPRRAEASFYDLECDKLDL